MSDETRDRILQAGLQAILQRSFNGAGLSQILGAAGVPKGSFYYYFASKESFGVAIVEEFVDCREATLRAALDDRRRSPRARLRGVFEASLAQIAQQGPACQCLVGKLALELAGLSEPIRGAIKCGLDRWQALLARTIREAQDAGEVPADLDPEATADVLGFAWEGALIRTLVDRDTRALERFLELVFDRLLV